MMASEIEIKSFPLRLDARLDELARNLVDGDKHFRGSRNQFYVECIEQGIAVRLGPEVLPPGKSPRNGSPSTDEAAARGATRGRPRGSVKRVVPSPIPEEEKQKTKGAKKPGKAKLEWKDGAVRAISNGQEYEIHETPAGPRPDAETPEDYFNRIKLIPGTVFVPVSKSFLDNPLINTAYNEGEPQTPWARLVKE